MAQNLVAQRLGLLLRLHATPAWRASLPPLLRNTQTKALSTLSLPNILRFARTPLSSVRNTYYGSAGSSYRSGYGGGGRPSSWFDRFRRRLDSIPSNVIFYGIIGINGAVYLMWWYSVETYKKFRDPSLYYWMNRNFTTSTRNLAEGRVWTLLTACFSHEDAGHIFMNLLTFYFMGGPALALLGNTGFLSLYLGGGLVSSAISTGYSYFKGRMTGSHGASGSISAVLAFYATMFPSTTFLLFMVIPMPAWLCVGGLAAFDLYEAVKNPNRRTDSAGHLGGFLGGLLYALRLRGRLF